MRASRLRVLFIAPHPIEGPSTRLRIYQFLPYLKEHGIEGVVRPFMSSEFAKIAFEPGKPGAKMLRLMWATVRRCVDVVGSGRWDIVFIHRDTFPLGPPILEAALRRLCPKLVFDFDDALHLRSMHDKHIWDRFKDLEKPAKIIRTADHVLVGNRFLQEYALRYSQKVTLFPTVIDTTQYTPAQPASRAGAPTIGWIGTPASGAYIQSLLPVLEQLTHRTSARIRCVGIKPFYANGLPVEFSPWSLERELADLRSFDIGVMPLFSTDVARAKCGGKLLQYMAVGVPSVASPVGANAEILCDGENGFLAREDAEWVRKLEQLVVDPTVRARLGAAGRETVETSYSVRAMAPRLLQLLEAVHAGG